MQSERPVHATTPLMSAAYFQEPATPEQEQPALEPAPPSRPDQTALMMKWMNLGIAGVIAVVVGCVLIVNLSAVDTKERGRRKCGFDWMLWASGSDQTFEEALMDRLEESQKEFEKQNPDMFKSKFETPPFDPNKPLIFDNFEPLNFGPQIVK